MIYRAYFAMISTPLINSKGKNTSAVYGFTNSLIKILDDEKPEHIAVCLILLLRHSVIRNFLNTKLSVRRSQPICRGRSGKSKEIIKSF